MATYSESQSEISESPTQRGTQSKAELNEIFAAVATALWAVSPVGKERKGTGHRPVATVNEAMGYPCSRAHTRPLRRLRNFPPILSAQFCPVCQQQCGDS